MAINDGVIREYGDHYVSGCLFNNASTPNPRLSTPVLISPVITFSKDDLSFHFATKCPRRRPEPTPPPLRRTSQKLIGSPEAGVSSGLQCRMPRNNWLCPFQPKGFLLHLQLQVLHWSKCSRVQVQMLASGPSVTLPWILTWILRWIKVIPPKRTRNRQKGVESR